MESTLETLNSTLSRLHVFVGSLAKDVENPLDFIASASMASACIASASIASASNASAFIASAVSSSFEAVSTYMSSSLSSASSLVSSSLLTASSFASSSFSSASSSASSTINYASSSASSTFHSSSSAAISGAHAHYDSASSFWKWALSISDPRVSDWPLMSSPWPTVLLTLTYLFIVYLGPKLMANRKAFDLRWLMVSYNLSMVLLCTFIWLQIVIGALRRNYSWICQPVLHDSHPEELRIAAGLWWFYVSKAIEFLDTFIFIMRKKSSQVTFLHVYHHATMFFFWWIGIKWVASGQTFFGPIINSVVHSVMYTYYGLAAIPACRKYLWWKKYMTWLQFIQFGIGIIWGGNTIRLNCGVPRWMQWASLVYGVSIIALFVNYYMQTYHKGMMTKLQTYHKGMMTKVQTYHNGLFTKIREKWGLKKNKEE